MYTSLPIAYTVLTLDQSPVPLGMKRAHYRSPEHHIHEHDKSQDVDLPMEST